MSLSVCVPTWNGEGHIAETLTSILSQTHGDFECLVVDDASTDGTVEVARSFRDPRVRVHVNPERRGIAGNSNRCLELARGEFICIFGHDDLMAPDNLARKLAALAADPAVSFVHSTADVLPAAPGPASCIGRYAEADLVSDGNTRFRELLLGGNHICCSTVVTRRQALLDAGGYDVELNYTCDYQLWMKLCVGRRVAFLAEPLVQYRWHEHNASYVFGALQRLDEIQQAGRRALRYYRQAIGRDDADALAYALEAVAKAQHDSAQLEQGKAWLESQVENWRKATENLTAVNADLTAHVANLEGQVGDLVRANGGLAGGHAALNAAHAALAADAAALRARLAAVNASRWVRIGRRLGVGPADARLSA